MTENGKKRGKQIDLAFTLTPIRGLPYTTSGKIANFTKDLSTMFFPEQIGKKLDVLISELMNNVLENSNDEDSQCGIRVKIDEQSLLVSVENSASPASFEKVKDHIATIQSSKAPLDLLAETIQKRRAEGLRDGLGLIRLRAESGAELACKYLKAKSNLVVEAKITMKGLL